MPPTCPGCGSSNPGDFDDSAGTIACRNCGAVVDDSFIVSEVQFGESSSGAAIVQGSYVGSGQSHAQSGCRYRSGTSIESREQTIAAGRQRINQIATVLHCPDFYAEGAQRWYTLAVTNNFTKGRKSDYVVACCLYISCRQQESSHMLIDFSDVLTINVFTLGQTYLKLIRLLNIKMPNIDPAIYVHRFAKHLEFGPEQNKVAKDALRLIQRMNRDWIVQGRRPSGICGAALILAARMNNFRRSVREVVYVVKVADLTIMKRLQEFKETKSGELTVEEFRSIWLEQSHDPPSFGPKKKKRKRVRYVNEDGEVVEEGGPDAAPPPAKEPRIDADGFVIPDVPIDPALRGAAPPPEGGDQEEVHPADMLDTHTSNIADTAIESELTALINEPSTTALVDSLLLSSSQSTVPDDPDGPDDLADVDDDPEVQCALLNEQESQLKEKIWTEFNKDWIKEQELKRLKALRDGGKTQRKRRKNKPRDSSAEDLAASPAESAKEMLKRRAYSKKINYKAIEGLFDD